MSDPKITMADLEDALREETSVVAPQDVAALMCVMFKKTGLCPPLYLLAEAERNEHEQNGTTEIQEAG